MSAFLSPDSITLEEKAHFNELLESYGFKSGLFGLVGGWLISNSGDLLGVRPSIPTKYPIMREMHSQHDWIEHLSSKSWFDASTQEDFEEAFEIAKALSRQQDNCVKSSE